MTIHIKKIASLTLALLLATAASAANNDKPKDNNGNGNNGNHYGQIKKDTPQVSQPRTSVPEPATLALMGAGALAVGVAALKRRRAKNEKK